MRIDKQKIEILMAEKQMTKSAIRKLCGLPESTMTTIFKRGTAQPVSIGKIARALDVPVREIIVDEGGQKQQ